MLLLSVLSALLLLNNQFEPGDGTESSVSAITESQCVCLGGNVTYECILVEPEKGFLVWYLNDGGVDTEIVVFNYGRNISSTEKRTQNVDGYAKLINNGSSVYISQLSFLVTSELDQQSVRCVQDNGTDERPIGTQTISIIKESDSDMLETPADVRLSSATQDRLVFTWNSPLQNCPSLNFTLEVEGCGSCNMDNITTAFCQNFSIPSNCSLSIRTVVCENITSSHLSTSENVSIIVPSAPDILESIAHYSQMSDKITGLTTKFNEVGQFNVSQFIDGSVSTYTILFSDSVNGTVTCDTMNVSPSQCEGGTCFNYFNLTSSQCFPMDISVTVYGINVFGNGIQSAPIVKAGTNTFVKVTFDETTTSLVCIFANQFTSGQISCNANVSYGDTCQNYLSLFNGSTSINTDGAITVTIPLILKRTQKNYCYVVYATNSTSSSFIEGSFYCKSDTCGNKMDRNVIPEIVGIIIAVIIIVSVTVTVILCLVTVLWTRRRKIQMIMIPSHQVLQEPLPLNDTDGASESHDDKMVMTDFSDLTNITRTCSAYEVTEDIFVVEFARKHNMHYKPTSGCGYFEFTKPEYILPETKIILMDKDRRFYTGTSVRRMIGISEEYDHQYKIDPPNLSGTKWQKVFIQTTLYNKTLLKGTTFLHNCAIFEEVNERYKIYDLTKDCITADLGQEHGLIPSYKPPNGLGYFQFTQPEYIPVTSKVILMDENGKLFSGNGARHFIQACESHYDESDLVEPPNLVETHWKHVFIQTHIYNKKLLKDTKFLFFEKGLVYLDEKRFQVTFYDVDESCVLANFAKKIPGYKVESGSGYFEFTEPVYVLPDDEVMLMDKNDRLYTGPGARDIIGIGDKYDFSKPVDPSKISSSNQWKCAFIQVKHCQTTLPKNTKFLHCRSALRKVSTCRVIPVAMPQPRDDCNVVDFIQEKVKDSKPTLNCCYYEFTENEYIPPDAEVVLLDKDGHYFTGPGARQIIEPNVKNKDELDTSKLQPPDFSSTEWQKAFIQTKSYDRKLRANTDFLYIQVFDEVEEFKLYDVPEDCSVVDFTKHKCLKIFDVAAGYGFYEFVDPEYIDLGKRIMLLDEDEKVFTGPGARQEIGLVDGTESTKIKPPDLSKSQWKHVFVQCKSYHRQLKKETKFLYCDTFLDRVDEIASTPDIFTVPKECQVFDFMTEKISSYSPSQGKGYYEFVKPEFIAPNKQVLLISKNNKIYTGPGARNFIGADVEYDDKAKIHPPNLDGTQWKCVLIQSTSHHRVLKDGTQFYYFKNGVTLM